MNFIKNNKAFLLTLLSVSAAYAAITFITPVDETVLQKYEINVNQLRLIQFVILIPVLVIWSFVLFGYWEFNAYAKRLKGAKESKGIHLISNALGVIAIQIIGLGLINVFYSYINAANGSTEEATTLQNIVYAYASILLGIFAYYYMFKGAESLHQKPIPNYKTKTYALLLLAVFAYTAALTWQKLSDADFGDDTVAGNLSLPMLLISIVAPYVISWYLALRSIKVLDHYAKNVKGILYKRIFNNLTQGLKIIIGFSVFSQVLTLFYEQLSALAIQPILIITFLLIICIGIGFMKVAQAAKLLRKLEEV